MNEVSGLSLRDALLWKKNQVADLKEFIDALCFFEGINVREATAYVANLMACGLQLYDKSMAHTGSVEIAQHLAMATVTAKLLDIPPPEINGEHPPAFENLFIVRRQVFKVFSQLWVAEPYPWPYPLEWVEDQQGKEINSINELSLSQTETVMMALGLMAKVLSNTKPIYRKSGTNEPNVSKIQDAVMQEAEEMELKTHGLSTALRIKIAKALNLLKEKQN